MKKIIFIIILIIIAVGTFFVLGKKQNENLNSPVIASKVDIAEIASYKYTEPFSHAEYNFSFKYPQEYDVTTFATETGEAVLVQNSDKGIGIQILISKFDGEDIDVTESVIKESIPDLKISDAQSVEIGNNRKGLAFLSNNADFGGESREVWFVFSGNLYQISTYASYDELLKGIFSTWQFVSE